MKKSILFLMMCALGTLSIAQFGTFKKKEEIDAFKETTLVIVWMQDSSFNESLYNAVERYWTFGPKEYAEENELKKYNKKDVAFLLFSKSVGSKIKAKLCTSEEDINGLVVARKFKKRIMKEDMVAYSFCSNKMDTADWDGEITRAVQMLNNYFNYASQAVTLNSSRMMKDYPSDRNLLLDRKLLVEDKMLDIKGKVDAVNLFDAEVVEVGREEIYRAVKSQEDNLLYYVFSKGGKYCNKMVVNAKNSELMWFYSDSPDKCKLSEKDLKALKKMKVDLLKKNK